MQGLRAGGNVHCESDGLECLRIIKAGLLRAHESFLCLTLEQVVVACASSRCPRYNDEDGSLLI